MAQQDWKIFELEEEIGKQQASLRPYREVLRVPSLSCGIYTLPAGDGFAIEDNTATIERLRVDETTGNISRNGALFVHTTGASRW